MSVGKSLFRLHWPMALGFGLVLLLAEAAAIAVIRIVGPVSFSLWLLISGSAPGYWLLVIGTMLVVTQLRQFVSNGVTRREFLLAAAVLGLSLAVAVALLVPLGHGVESAALAATGRRAAGYPVFAAGPAFAEFGRSLARSLAFFVSGGLFGAIFYRYSVWTGLALLIPAALPLAAGQGLLSYDGTGTVAGPLPYWPALLVTCAAMLGGAFWLRLTMRDVAIRRTQAA